MNIHEATQLLKEKGHKQTDKRDDMLKLFADSKRYLSAKNVQEALKPKYPKLSYDTIYRNLALFAEMGIFETTELGSEKQFRFVCDISTHHHHFICLTCGATKEISLCPMNGIKENLAGYQISSHKFEIYGACPACSKEEISP